MKHYMHLLNILRIVFMNDGRAFISEAMLLEAVHKRLSQFRGALRLAYISPENGTVLADTPKLYDSA